ncbi:hypothetical protein N9R59_01685 [Porticoccaceae bacterium]|nr:hypothetical protein [Porticoccaceae bacterium]
MKKTKLHFGNAENKDQDRFDEVQLGMSEDEMEKGLSALVELYKSKKADNIDKQQAILDQPSGKTTDPILKYLLDQGEEVTQEMYLAIAHPEGMDAETEAMLPEEFHSLPVK